MADQTQALRTMLRKILAWQDAHATFDAAIDGIPPKLRGVQPEGLPYSAWQLLEHLRIAQEDILEFCVNADYQERKWPDTYWPSSAAPHSDTAWNESIARYRKDRDTLERLAMDPTIDLFAKIPHGSGQTYLRELLLVADHNAYHVGQLVAVRRLLGIWDAA